MARALSSAASQAPAALGDRMHALARELFPIHRSMAGPGVRETLSVLGSHIPIELREIPTGTRVLDWEVPQEWRIRDAFVKDGDGRRVVDYRASNLHVVSHSAGIDTRMRWSELLPYLHSLPERPDWIPYRTRGSDGDWGFCLTHRRLLELESRGDAEYEISIDAELRDGSLTYGELYIPGETAEEVLFSCHVCHPSLANDNLSGIAVATFIARHLLEQRSRYSYRFLFIPATIGAIAWLGSNPETTRRVRHGLVLSLLGDPGAFTYKKSRRGDARIDRAVGHVLGSSGRDHSIREFEPFGYDERQFCSPGFDLPMGCLMRTPNGEYPEYHSSADDLELIRPDCLADSLRVCLDIVEVLEEDRTYLNLRPHGEPHLSRWGLHRGFGRDAGDPALQQAILWILNQSDGTRSLLDVAERSGMTLSTLVPAARQLLDCGLIREERAEEPTPSDGPNRGGQA